MRYQYCVPVLTTVTDDEIVESDQIKKLLVLLSTRMCSVQMCVELSPDYLRNFSSVRITEVNEETVKFTVFADRAMAKYVVPLHAIQSIKLIADNQIYTSKDKITRFDYLDVINDH